MKLLFIGYILFGSEMFRLLLSICRDHPFVLLYSKQPLHIWSAQLKIEVTWFLWLYYSRKLCKINSITHYILKIMSRPLQNVWIITLKVHSFREKGIERNHMTSIFSCAEYTSGQKEKLSVTVLLLIFVPVSLCRWQMTRLIGIFQTKQNIVINTETWLDIPKKIFGTFMVAVTLSVLFYGFSFCMSRSTPIWFLNFS